MREAAQAYVILSRVQALSQLFILESVCQEKIYPSYLAIGELEKMYKKSANTRRETDKCIISCNIRSFKKKILTI